MKQRAFCLALLLLSTTIVHAEMDRATGWYGRIDVGTSNSRDPQLQIPTPLPAELGNSVLLGGGIGYSLVPGLSADFTVSYRSGFQQISGFPQMPTGKADFSSLVGLASFYMHFFGADRVAPYAGAGWGVTRNKLGTVRIANPDGSPLGFINGKKKTGFAWQVCAGVDIGLSNRMSLDAGYHYLDAGKYQSQDQLFFADNTSISARDVGEFRANEFQMGLRFTF